jgi:hypothetical protein
MKNDRKMHKQINQIFISFLLLLLLWLLLLLLWLLAMESGDVLGAIVTIQVVEGRRLAAKDVGGTSDPYPIIGCVNDQVCPSQ